MTLRTRLLALAGLLALATSALAQTQGVGKNELVIGTIQDLSGPLSSAGKTARNGMQLRVDEINEQGGVHGRKLVLKVEDSGYDPKRSSLAAQKLVNLDKIFLMAGHIGTAHNMAAFPIQFAKNVVNFMPLTAAREMYDPPHKLKYALLSTYFDQMRTLLPHLVKTKNAKRVCINYQDDEFGLEVLRGTEAALQSLGTTLAERASFKRGSTDFSSQMARLKAASCDLVVLGTIIRETIGSLAEASKIDFKPTFVGTVASYSDVIHKLGGRVTNGYYAAMTVQTPYLDEASQPLRFWANKYRTRFDEDPSVFSVYGYLAIDLFIKGAEKAGRNLTTDSFVRAMDSITVPSDIFGSPVLSYSATKRLGNDLSRLSQIQDGRWKVVSDYTKP